MKRMLQTFLHSLAIVGSDYQVHMEMEKTVVRELVRAMLEDD